MTEANEGGTARVDAETVVELAKRRGFFLQSCEAYGGVSGFYTFGPQGAALKRHLEDAWRERFTVQEGHREIESPTVMPEPVFEASGHLDGFDDMLVECPECGESHRADHIVEDATDIEEAESLPIPEVEEVIAEYELACPNCGTGLAGQAVDQFNLMFETNIGPGSSDPGFLRPETAQGIFVEFPLLKEYARGKLPFGITQIGRAYRNEISPRKSIVRVREFTQAELELFIDPEVDEPPLESVRDVDAPLYSAEMQAEGTGPQTMTIGEASDKGVLADPWVAYYVGVAKPWYEAVGVDMDRFRFRQHNPGELAHYAADCWDAESQVDGDWIELAGVAYRGDYDLSKHAQHSDEDFTLFKQYDEPTTVERATVDPDMSYLGPEFGGEAADVADALERLAERDRSAFEGDEVVVAVDGTEYVIPTDKTGFTVEAVTEAGEHITPHVVEPSFGIDRLLYTVVHHAYREDVVDGEERTYLDLEPTVAPTSVGVFPLQSGGEMESVARAIVDRLRTAGLAVTDDDSGSIGRRYRRQDEVGTPFCVTVDHQSLKDDTVTVRDRDTTEQVRVTIDDLPEVLSALLNGEQSFEELA
ncbi:MAG: glycyl-tRNA synthetase [Natrialbaceae archaeon]|jgi:glycyl-tRNA synthetase